MPQFTLNLSASMSGINGQFLAAATDNIGSIMQPTVLPAQPGQLTTRTSGTAGTLTMQNANHGIVTGQRIDIYWTGGQCYNATVGTVSGASVPFTAVSGGSAWPSLNTEVVAGICLQVDGLAVNGANLSALFEVLPAGTSGYFVYDTSVPADVLADFVVGPAPNYWYTGGPGSNPLSTNTVASVWFSHNNTLQSVQMQAGLLSH